MFVWGGFNFVYTGGRYSYVDSDGDGEGDASDCAPAHPSVFSVPAITGLRVAADTVIVLWDSGGGPGAGGSIIYDALRGSLAELPAGNRPAEACLASRITTTTLTDPTVPGYGDGLWYLVRGTNICGAGPYGCRATDRRFSAQHVHD